MEDSTSPTPRSATGIQYMLAGGTVIAALGLLIDPSALLPKTAPSREPCESVVQPQAVLPRDRLSQFLTLPERTNADQVRQVIQAPFCRLPAIQVRSGATATREAYPLAFDPQTWLVVLYEGNEYVGYDFAFRR